MKLKRVSSATRRLIVYSGRFEDDPDIHPTLAFLAVLGGDFKLMRTNIDLLDARRGAPFLEREGDWLVERQPEPIKPSELAREMNK